MRVVACLRVFGLGALVSSCSPDLFFDAPEISAIIVSAGPFLPSSGTELNVGEAVTLSAVVREGGGTPIEGVPVEWQSTNPAVATVSTQGRVVAVAGGTASIRASFAGVTGVYGITVRSPVATVTLSPTAATLGIGSTQQLTATLRDASNNILTGRTIAWSSSNAAVAAVSATGVVTAGTAGTATVTATSEGRSGAATITVGAPACSTANPPAENQLICPNVTYAIPTTSTNVVRSYQLSRSSTLGFSVLISGGVGDADLYVFNPSDLRVCFLDRAGNDETCNLSGAIGTWIIQVRAYASFSGVSLRIQ